MLLIISSTVYTFGEACTFNLYDFKGLSQAKPEDEDPLFGDIANEGAALSLSSSDGTRIEFSRNNSLNTK